MINAILQTPTLYFYGKANSGKTASLLKISEVFAPFYKEVHFFSPNRVSYYTSIIKEKNIAIHTVRNSDSLITSLNKLDKGSLVLIDDISMVADIANWKIIHKQLQEFNFHKLIITMDANPHVLNVSDCLPVLRCEHVNNEVVIQYEQNSMLLKDIITFLNRNLTLDNYW